MEKKRRKPLEIMRCRNGGAGRLPGGFYWPRMSSWSWAAFRLEQNAWASAYLIREASTQAPVCVNPPLRRPAKHWKSVRTRSPLTMGHQRAFSFSFWWFFSLQQPIYYVEISVDLAQFKKVENKCLHSRQVFLLVQSWSRAFCLFKHFLFTGRVWFRFPCVCFFVISSRYCFCCHWRLLSAWL